MAFLPWTKAMCCGRWGNDADGVEIVLQGALARSRMERAEEIRTLDPNLGKVVPRRPCVQTSICEAIAAVHESPPGPKRTHRLHRLNVRFWPRADIGG